MNAAFASLAALLASAALASGKPALEGAVPGQWTMDFDAAQKVAAEKKLPLLLNFTGSDWCGWCKHMDKEVFSKDAWGAYAKDHLVLVWLDFPQDKSLVPEKFAARNSKLSERFGVGGYPTYIVLDDDGKTKLGQLGADQEISPDKFIGSLKALLKHRPSIVEALLKTLPKEKSSAYRAKRARLAAAKAELDAWVATRPERSEANITKFNAWNDELAALEKESSALLENK
jgi:thioredoxin-related protein